MNYGQGRALGGNYSYPLLTVVIDVGVTNKRRQHFVLVLIHVITPQLTNVFSQGYFTIVCACRLSLYGCVMEAKYHDQQFEDALTVIQGLSDPGGTVCRILRESSAAASATGDETESMSGYVSQLC